jgi:hypothetical protein
MRSILIITLLCSSLIGVTYLSPFAFKLGLLLDLPPAKGLYLLRQEDHHQSTGMTLPSMTLFVCTLIKNIIQHQTINHCLQASL